MKLTVVKTASIRRRGAADSMLPSWRKRCHVMNNGAAGKTASTMKANMALVVTVPSLLRCHLRYRLILPRQVARIVFLHLQDRRSRSEERRVGKECCGPWACGHRI